MNFPTNAIALLGNEYARKCCRRGMSGVLRQRTWGILLPKRTLDRLSGRPEAASSLQIDSHRITVIVNLDTLGVLQVG